MWKMRNKIIVFAKNVIYMDKALEYDGLQNNYVAPQNSDEDGAALMGRIEITCPKCGERFVKRT